MSVRLLDLKAHHEPLRGAILEAFERVADSGHFILGPEVNRFEDRIASYCRTEFAVGVSSGTDALLVSLMALGIGPGDEVITTPFSFFATAGSVVRAGGKPVFVDIDPVTYNIDPTRIGDAVTSRTKAILPVHLFGQCAEMDPILDLAERHRLRVIEDAAQAIGAEYRRGRRAGSMGDLGCLSFYPSKNLGAFGDAGMVVTDHRELAERVRALRVHGAEGKYYHRFLGGNFRLDAVQAAVLNVKFDHLDGWTRRRRANADRYRSMFEESGLLEKVEVSLPRAVVRDTGVEQSHTYNQFVVRVPDRDRLRVHLRSRGIETEVYYPVPLHLQPCFRDLGHRDGDFPESERAAKETLALPVYPELTRELQERVVTAIAEFYI